MLLRRVHIPACVSVEDHIHAAYAELGDIPIGLLEFCDQAMTDWLDEQQIADGGDQAVVAYWAEVEAERILGIEHWAVS